MSRRLVRGLRVIATAAAAVVLVSSAGWFVSRVALPDALEPRVVMAVGLPDGLHIATLDGRTVRRLRDDGPYFQPAWSTDGTLVAATALTPRDDNDLVVVRPDGSLVAEMPGVVDFEWAPNSHRLAIRRVVRQTIAIIDLDQGTRLDLQMPPDVDVLSTFAWAPDGRAIVAAIAGATAGRNGELWLLDPNGGEPRRWIDATPAAEPAWSGSGARIAAVFSRCPETWCESDIRVLDALTGGRRSELLHLTEPADLAWSPDSRYLAFDAVQAGERDVHVFELERGKVTRMDSRSAFDRVVGWIPDGFGIVVARRSEVTTGAGFGFWLLDDEHSAASLLIGDAYGVAIQPRP